MAAGIGKADMCFPEMAAILFTLCVWTRGLAFMLVLPLLMVGDVETVATRIRCPRPYSRPYQPYINARA